MLFRSSYTHWQRASSDAPSECSGRSPPRALGFGCTLLPCSTICAFRTPERGSGEHLLSTSLRLDDDAQDFLSVVIRRLQGPRAKAVRIRIEQAAQWPRQVELVLGRFNKRMEFSPPHLQGNRHFLGNPAQFREPCPTQTRDRKSTRLNSSHTDISRMPSSA